MAWKQVALRMEASRDANVTLHATAFSIRAWWRSWNRGAPLAEMFAESASEGQTNVWVDVPGSGRSPHEDNLSLIWLDFSLRWSLLPNVLRQSTLRVSPMLSHRASGTPLLVLVPDSDGFAFRETGALFRAAAAALGLDEFPPDMLGERSTEETLTALHQLFAQRFGPPALPVYKDAGLADGQRLMLSIVNRRGEKMVGLAAEGSPPRWFVRPFDWQEGSFFLGELTGNHPDAGQGAFSVTASVGPVWGSIRSTWDELLRSILGMPRPLVDYWSSNVFLGERILDRTRICRVELVPDLRLPSSEHRGYRVIRQIEHPVWGRLRLPSASRFVDELLEEGANVAYLSGYDDDPGRAAIADQVSVEGFHRTDPEVLILQSKRNDWPDVAWLKPDTLGTGALRDRKWRISKAAMPLRSIERVLLRPADTQTPRPPWITLGTLPPVHLIQGPPGTGKTWTACQAILGYSKAHPGARILVSAKEHLALNHITEALHEHAQRESQGIKVLRLGVEEDDNPYGFPDWLKDLATEVKTHAPATVAKLVESRGWETDLGVAEADVIVATAADQAILDFHGSGNPEGFDLVVIEEAGKLTHTELAPLIALAPQSILIGDTMQLPPYGYEETKEILDRLVKLMPVSEPQHADEKVLNRILAAQARELGQPPAGLLQPFRWLQEEKGAPSIMLTNQRRMRPALSDAIAEIFYNTKFHDSKAPGQVSTPKWGELVWFDTPHSSESPQWGEKRNPGGSIQNAEEANASVRLVSSALEAKVPPEQIVVLAPYQGQVDLIRRSLTTRKGDAQRVKVQTTDGFQGQEADVIILSLVRNNNESTPSARWGFMVNAPRLNVAFSRAREALWVVGCQRQVEETDWPSGEEHLPKMLLHFRKHGLSKSVKQIG